METGFTLTPFFYLNLSTQTPKILSTIFGVPDQEHLIGSGVLNKYHGIGIQNTNQNTDLLHKHTHQKELSKFENCLDDVYHESMKLELKIRPI